MFLKSLIYAAAASAMLFSAPASAQEAQNDEPLKVVELFTSQGCSSCPPADAVLRGLKDRDDILALSWAVDYWDRLGWKDTFGDPQHSRRQRAYNKRMGRSGVYTPQMIIDGRYQVVGSRRDDVEEAIVSADNDEHMISTPTVHTTGDMIEIDLAPATLPQTVAVRIVWYLSEAAVNVQRGENRGRELVYTNVVRYTEMAEDWNGAARTIAIDPEHGEKLGADHVAVLLHKGFGEGEILAAAKISLNDPALASGR